MHDRSPLSDPSSVTSTCIMSQVIVCSQLLIVGFVLLIIFQCETSLDGESAGCWCVYPKNGRRIPGSPETKGDTECQEYLNLQE